MSVGDLTVEQVGSADEAGSREACEAKVIATELVVEQFCGAW